MACTTSKKNAFFAWCNFTRKKNVTPAFFCQHQQPLWQTAWCAYVTYTKRMFHQERWQHVFYCHCRGEYIDMPFVSILDDVRAKVGVARPIHNQSVQALRWFSELTLTYLIVKKAWMPYKNGTEDSSTAWKVHSSQLLRASQTSHAWGGDTKQHWDSKQKQRQT